jgi:hypothetical protein
MNMCWRGSGWHRCKHTRTRCADEEAVGTAANTREQDVLTKKRLAPLQANENNNTKAVETAANNTTK